jgi:hypothetical protein
VGPGASPTKTTHLIYSATHNGGQGEAPATKSTALSQRFHTHTEGGSPLCWELAATIKERSA